MRLIPARLLGLMGGREGWGKGPPPPQFGFAPRQLIHILSHQLSLL